MGSGYGGQVLAGSCPQQQASCLNMTERTGDCQCCDAKSVSSVNVTNIWRTKSLHPSRAADCKGVKTQVVGQVKTCTSCLELAYNQCLRGSSEQRHEVRLDHGCWTVPCWPWPPTASSRHHCGCGQRQNQVQFYHSCQGAPSWPWLPTARSRCQGGLLQQQREVRPRGVLTSGSTGSCSKCFERI